MSWEPPQKTWVRRSNQHGDRAEEWGENKEQPTRWNIYNARSYAITNPPEGHFGILLSINAPKNGSSTKNNQHGGIYIILEAMQFYKSSRGAFRDAVIYQRAEEWVEHKEQPTRWNIYNPRSYAIIQILSRGISGFCYLSNAPRPKNAARS
jgi:hypothetical protein